MLRLDQSDKNADWPYLTAAAPNWEGTTWNGDPGAVEGTTVAVTYLDHKPANDPPNKS